MTHSIQRRALSCLAGLAVAMWGLLATSFAQIQPVPCAQPPSCIINSSLEAVGPGYGNMNSSPALTVPAWYVSHGTPSLFGGAPVPGGLNYSVWMWSYSGMGEGIFTCYNFRRGETYKVCLWVRNTNGIAAGNLIIRAANGVPIGSGGVPPTPSSSQLISNAFVNSPGWVQVTYTFTANADYRQLWIYPFMAGPPINNQQYELQIDLVRVAPVPRVVPSSTITWCESVEICVDGGSPGSTYTWSPATGLSSTTGRCVYARPCTTTTYQIIVQPPSDCPSCGPDTLYHTVYVDVPNFEIHGTKDVRCGEKIEMKVDPVLSCVSYDWFDPHGNYIGSGPNISIPNASGDDAGTYTLVIRYGDCVIYLHFDVNVLDCPCEFKPDFKWDRCNPVYFFDMSNSMVGGSAVAWFWDFGDGNSSNLQNPVHSYASAGGYKVCLTVIWKNGNQTCCDRICFDVEVCDPQDQRIDMSAPENEGSSMPGDIRKESSVEVFPNPAGDQAWVALNNIENARVTLRSINGSIISTGRQQGDNNRYLLDLNGIASGIYVVIVESSERTFTVKMVKD